MEEYLDSKPDDFDGIAAKRFLLGQAREQVSWYRRSIEGLDFVGYVACRRALETGQSFLEHYLPAYNFRETDRGTEYKRDAAFPILPPMWSRRDPDDDEREGFRETDRGTEYKRDAAFPILPPMWSRRDPFPDVPRC